MPTVSSESIVSWRSQAVIASISKVALRSSPKVTHCSSVAGSSVATAEPAMVSVMVCATSLLAASIARVSCSSVAWAASESKKLASSLMDVSKSASATLAAAVTFSVSIFTLALAFSRVNLPWSASKALAASKVPLRPWLYSSHAAARRWVKSSKLKLLGSSMLFAASTARSASEPLAAVPVDTTPFVSESARAKRNGHEKGAFSWRISSARAEASTSVEESSGLYSHVKSLPLIVSL